MDAAGGVAADSACCVPADCNMGMAAAGAACRFECTSCVEPAVCLFVASVTLEVMCACDAAALASAAADALLAGAGIVCDCKFPSLPGFPAAAPAGLFVAVNLT